MKHIALAAILLLAALAALMSGLRAPEPDGLAAACPPGAYQADSSVEAATTDLRTKVSSMLVTGFVGDRVSDERFVEFLDFLRSYPTAGVIHLERNVRRPADVLALNVKLSEVLDRPFIMVDEEGGAVSRLGRLPHFPALPAAREIARANSPAEARLLYDKLAKTLGQLGFNVNLGPVVDLARNPRNPVIAGYGRAYSAEPDIVIDFARSFSLAHAEAGILTALKHFPGHGSSTTDTHFRQADVTQTWHPDELVPFARLIEGGLAPMVMTSHVTLASEALGQSVAELATFSPGMVGYIRGRLCHDGLVISDDMTMSAVAEHHSLAEGLEKAIRAGHDLVIVAAPRWIGTRRIARAVDVVAARAEADPELTAAIDSAYRRVAAFKRERLRDLLAFERKGSAPWGSAAVQ